MKSKVIFGRVHYSAAKSGMLGMSKTMARELEPFGIRIIQLLLDL